MKQDVLRSHYKMTYGQLISSDRRNVPSNSVPGHFQMFNGQNQRHGLTILKLLWIYLYYVLDIQITQNALIRDCIFAYVFQKNPQADVPLQVPKIPPLAQGI